MSGHIRRARHDERQRITEIRFAVQENRLADPSLVTDEDYAWFEEHPGIWGKKADKSWASPPATRATARSGRSLSIRPLSVAASAAPFFKPPAIRFAAPDIAPPCSRPIAAPERSDSIEPPAGKSSATAPEAN
jgi:hypothetical protein